MTNGEERNGVGPKARVQWPQYDDIQQQYLTIG